MTPNAIKPLPPCAGTYFLHRGGIRQEDYNELRSWAEDCLARLRVAVGALNGLAELAPHPEEYINASEWRCGAQDMAHGVAKQCRAALAAGRGEGEKT